MRSAAYRSVYACLAVIWFVACSEQASAGFLFTFNPTSTGPSYIGDATIGGPPMPYAFLQPSNATFASGFLSSSVSQSASETATSYSQISTLAATGWSAAAAEPLTTFNFTAQVDLHYTLTFTGVYGLINAFIQNESTTAFEMHYFSLLTTQTTYSFYGVICRKK